MKNVGNSSRGRSQGAPKIFRAPMYTAHCAVIFAIAQLSFYRRLQYRSDNYILRILLGLRKYGVTALLSKYGIFSIQTSVYGIKHRVGLWQKFVDVSRCWSFLIYEYLYIVFVLFSLYVTLRFCVFVFYIIFNTKLAYFYDLCVLLHFKCRYCVLRLCIVCLNCIFTRYMLLHA